MAPWQRNMSVRKTLDLGVMGGNILPPPKKSGLGENLILYVFGRVFLKIYVQFLHKPIILAWLTLAMIRDTFWAFEKRFFLEKKASQT
jgi:hypothetical protein